MRWLLLISLILASTAAYAQSDDEPGFFGRLFGGDDTEAEEDPGGFLERTIEENLSGEGRDVAITGFEGLLGGEATLDTMTISDADGVWLRLEDVTLDWSRLALLRGRLEIEELSAAVIELPRLPLPAEGGPPTPEASGFSLPELPVSVEIGRIAAERVDIGEPVFGAETIASIEGSMSLANGEGAAVLEIDRLDDAGSLSLDISYANATQVLALDVSLDEGPDGIVANLLDLPGRPSVTFSVAGEDPISAFAADLALGTDGVERLTGRIETETPDDASFRFTADIRGDIAPVFLPAYQDFFGRSVELVTRVTTFEDGRISLDNLTLAAASLTLTGQVEVGSDGLPDTIDVAGSIRGASGDPVLLPLSGPETRVERVELDVDFDAAAGDRWNGAFEISGLSRPGFSAETLLLDGTGQISGGVDTATVTANLNVEATSLDLGNEDAEDALGESVTGGADIAWASGGPIRLSSLAINGETYSLAGFADIGTSEDGVDAQGQVTVNANDLSVFSGIAQRNLGGAAELETTFDAQPLAGFFDIDVSGSTTDLVIDQPEADRILAGQALLEFEAVRNANGVSATLTTLESPNASITGQAVLRTGSSNASISANLVDVALVLPDVSGPVRLTASTEQEGDLWRWRANGGLEGTTLDAEGTAVDVFGTPIIEAGGTFTAEDLSNFSAIARRDIGGAIDARFSGEVVADLSRANLSVNGVATDLTIDQEQADILMSGPVEIGFDAAVAGEVISVRNTTINGRNLTLTADGTLTESAGSVEAEGRIASAALILEGAPEGALEFRGETRRDGRDWAFAADVLGPNLSLSTEGFALDPTGPAAAVEGEVSARADDLSIFSELAGRDLTGNIAVNAKGGVSFDLKRFALDGVATGSGLSVDQQQADLLLDGNLSLRVDASRNGDEISVEDLQLSTRLLDVEANGALGATASAIDLDARLADLGVFVAGFSGPLTIDGTIAQDGTGSDFEPDLSMIGPGGTNATLRGRTADDFSTVNLDIDGNAPLGLLNQFIQPRSIAGTAGFDLSVNGPPALESLSGVITTSGTRLVTPTLGVTLNDIAGSITLGGGRATVSMAALPEAGGRLSIEGPVTLTGAFNTDLAIRLQQVVLTDPRLYETSVDGTITVVGPLRGGARIGGNLVLGETTVRIPSSSIGGTGAIPEVVHINEPPPVRSTRSRAGLLETVSESSGTSGPGLALDILITAPNQLFVRGRGLDAEFAGDLRVTGTTNDVVPIGAFNLVRGRLDILGQRLNIEEATITLQGSFIPVIRVVATTQSDEFNINVIVSGPASNPEIAFTSEPDLPEEEVLARLLFGRGLDTLSPIQAARLALAVRTLAGQGGEGLVGSIREGAGLADFDVTTDDEGNTQVRAGAYLSENLYTDVTVGGGGQTVLNLNLDVTPSLTLKGSASSDGDTSIGIFFERDY